MTLLCGCLGEDIPLQYLKLFFHFCLYVKTNIINWSLIIMCQRPTYAVFKSGAWFSVIQDMYVCISAWIQWTSWFDPPCYYFNTDFEWFIQSQITTFERQISSWKITAWCEKTLPHAKIWMSQTIWWIWASNNSLVCTSAL